MDAGQRSTQRRVSETEYVRIRVTPRGGRDALVGWKDGVLHVRIAAPPVDGRANDALVRFLAKVSGLPVSRVRIAGGEHGREKRIAFDGIDRAVLRKRLGIPAGA